MRRRGFLRALGAGLLAAPLAVEAQPIRKLPRVGVLITANPRLYDAFVDELRRLGYVDARTSSSSSAMPKDGSSAFPPSRRT